VAYTLPKPEKFHEKMLQLATSLGLHDPPASTAKRLGVFRDYLSQSNEWIRRYHKNGGSGLRIVQCRSIAMDVLIEQLYNMARIRVQGELGEICTDPSLVALGGYGRSEMCPHSDVDLMFLYPVKVRSKNFAETQRLFNDTILYMLWDLNLKVGHSTRNIKEVIAEASEEDQSKNALLESRLICGDKSLFSKFTKEYARFIRKDDVNAYLNERLEDQHSRRKKQGGTVFLQEPDIKNGVGGLRDFQSLLWMTRLQFEGESLNDLVKLKLLRRKEYHDLTKSYDFLLRVRNELHYQSRHATDLLDLEKQPSVAWALGYRQRRIFPRVEKFMRDYYRAAYKIYHLSEYLEQRLSMNAKTSISFQSVLESRRVVKMERFDGFEADGKYMSADSILTFKRDPLRLIRVFRHLQSRSLKADFDLVRLIEENLDLIDDKLIQSEEANRSFRAILQSKGEVFPVLSLMNSTGVLPRFMPEWAGLHCLVQHEYYHRYTADEHVLHTIQELDKIFSGEEPEITRKYRLALEDTELPGLMYLILLLHDIGKAKGIENHAEVGAVLAEPILKRLGVVTKARDKILFLVKNHLEMARIWQRYDLDDPRTAEKLSELVHSGENLRYLYVLTFCDARGTTHNLWNGYKDAMHTLLFRITLNNLQTPSLTPPALPMISQAQILEKTENLSHEEVEAHFNLLPERYFSYNSEKDILLHLRMIHRLLETISNADSIGSLVPVIEWQDDLNLGLTVVHVITWDRAGLFYKLAGALTLAGLSIVSSKALSRSDHISIDTFYVSDPKGGPVKDTLALKTFQKHLEEALIRAKSLLPDIEAMAENSRRPSYVRSDPTLAAAIPVRVDVYHEMSLKRTIIEIEANDELGLLYKLARSITKHGFDISFARISTERAVAVDTFYIERSLPSEEDETTQDLIDLKAQLLEMLQSRALKVES